MDRTLLPALLLCLCGTARAEAPPEKPFRGKTFAQWRAMLGHPDAKVRGRAATALGLGPFGKQSVPALLQSLADKDPEVRRSAIIALGDIGPNAAEAVPVLATALVIEEAVDDIRRALLKMGPTAIPVLLDEARKANRMYSSVFASPFCATMGPAALPHLIAALRDPNEEIRCQAARELAGFRADASPAVPALVQALGDQSRLVQEAAASALAAVGPPARAAAPALQALVGKGDGVEKWAALQALVTLDHGRALPLLAEKVRRGESLDSTLAALASIGPPALNSLEEIFRTNSAETRAFLLTQSGIGSPEALPLVRKGLKDENPDVRWAAAQALRDSEADLTPLLSRLERAIDKEEPEMGRDLVRAVARICPPPPEALALLAGTLRHRDQAIAVAAGTELEDLGAVARPVLPLILSALRDHREAVRRQVMAILGRVAPGERLVVRALCAALKDEDASVSPSAVEVLASSAPAIKSAGIAASVGAPVGVGAMQAGLVAAGLLSR